MPWPEVDLRLPSSLQSHSPMSIAKYMPRFSWSEESYLLWIAHYQRYTHNGDKEKSSGQASLCSIWTIDIYLSPMRHLKWSWFFCIVFLKKLVNCCCKVVSNCLTLHNSPSYFFCYCSQWGLLTVLHSNSASSDAPQILLYWKTVCRVYAR
jgi:hypothetical protein